MWVQLTFSLFVLCSCIICSSGLQINSHFPKIYHKIIGMWKGKNYSKTFLVLNHRSNILNLSWYCLKMTAYICVRRKIYILKNIIKNYMYLFNFFLPLYNFFFFAGPKYFLFQFKVCLRSAVHAESNHINRFNCILVFFWHIRIKSMNIVDKQVHKRYTKACNFLWNKGTYQ